MDVRALVLDAARRHGVPEDLALEVAHQESRFNQAAVSPKGARGVMQLMPGTARELGVNADDIHQNIDGGVRYLKQQLDAFGGDPRLAKAAYNAGPGNVRKYGGVPPFAETRAYVGDTGGGGVQDGFDGSDIFGMGQAAPTGGGGQSGDFDGADIFATPKPKAAPTSPPPQRGQAGGTQQNPITLTTANRSQIPEGAFFRTSTGDVRQQQKGAGYTPDTPKRGLLSDVSQSAVYGTGKGAAGLGDMLMAASPLGMAKMQLRNVLNLANLAQGSGSARPAMMPGMSLLSNREAAMDNFTPQTEAGKFTRTAATFLPNAALPGTLPEKVASVVAPAVGQESFQRGAKALGLDERGQQIAGVAGATLGGLATGVRVNRPATAKLPTADLGALDKVQSDAWKLVDASTYKFPAKDVRATAKDVRSIVTTADPDLYPEAAKFASKLERMASRGDLTLGKLNTLKSQIGEKLLQPGSTEASVGREMQVRIENLINTSKDPSLAAAREAYKRFMKVKDVSQRVDDAELNRMTAGTGANGNAVRQALKPLIKSRGGQRMTNATPDEVKAIKRVVGGTPSQNALRVLTAFDPTAGKMQAFVSGIIGAGTMGKSLLLAPLGMAAKAGEHKIEDANVQQLLDLLAAGGVPPKSTPLLSASSNPYAFAPGFTGALLASPALAAPQPKRKPPQR